MAGYRIPGPLVHGAEEIDEGTSALTRSPTPGPIGVSDPWGNDPDPRLDYDVWGRPISRKKLKKELAADIGQLILDITGIFDPTPLSDGTNALISLARGRWLDALVSTVSIVPYVGDVSKIAKLPGYSRSIKKAIRLARVDFFWKTRLRDLFFPLRTLLDKALALGADNLPDVTRKYLQEMRYEIDQFLTPDSMRVLKPKPRAKVEHSAPSSGPSSKSRSPNKEKTKSETSDDALKEKKIDSSVTEETRGVKDPIPEANVVPDKNVFFSSNELAGVERASANLLNAVGQKRAITFAEEGSDALRFLDYRNAEAAAFGAEDILLRTNPSKAAVLEEFLHGTQQKLGIIDDIGRAASETHVKEFMIRHQRMLGLREEDVRRLQILKDMGL